MFDLPTETAADRKNAHNFRENLRKNGFMMFQFSVYLRHCPSHENAEVHVKRVKGLLPPLGYVAILRMTDKQYGMMITYYGRHPVEKPPTPQQLELF